MEFTVIIMGRLEFNNLRSIGKAKEVIGHLLETRYKHESLYKDIEMFNEELLAFIAPREKHLTTDKVWQNTLHLLELSAQFAVAGDIRIWKIKEGKLQSYERVEPKSDKSIIKYYQAGRRLLKEKKYSEAREKFTLAVNKFPRHAMAMEARAFTHWAEGNNADALIDYAASISIDDKRPEAFLGRGIISMENEDWAQAVDDFTIAMKRSMPHHDVYLEALHRKGKCLMKLDEHDKAIAAFNFFLGRPLLKDHPQFPFRRQVAFDKGKSLAALGKGKEAKACFDEALKMPTKDGAPTEDEILSFVK